MPAKIVPGRNARFAGKIFKASLLKQPSRTSCSQSLLRKGQFRLRRAKRAALDKKR